MATKKKTETRGRKPGTPKTGGRTAGTPNKESRHVLNALATAVEVVRNTPQRAREVLGEMPTEFTPEFIQWLGNYWLSSTFIDDWTNLKSSERFTLYERLYQFRQAKKSATQNDLTLLPPATIEDDLNQLAEEFNSEQNT